MRRIVRGALVLVSLAAAGCPAGPVDTDETDVPETGDCFDAARNGDETDIDCGGPCEIDCGIDQACGSGDDCMFGSCAGDVCVAPIGGPAPTGPVTATLAPEGGVVSVVSAEGVSLTISLPAGAVADPVELTFTPGTPGAGQWLDVTLSSGVVLAEPATLTITLPPGLDLPDDARTTFSEETAGPRALPTTTAGATATTTVRFLGRVGRPPGQARDGEEEVDLELQKQALTLLVERLSTKIDALVADFDYAQAVATRMELLAVLQSSDDPDFQGIAGSTLTSIETTACSQLHDAAFLLDPPGSDCTFASHEKVKPTLGWMSILQATGGDAACSQEVAAAHAAVSAERSATREWIAGIEDAEDSFARRGLYLDCECATTREELVAGCSSGRSAADDDYWVRRVESIGENSMFGVVLGVSEVAGARATWETELAAPFESASRDDAWDLCHDDGEQWVQHALSEEVGEGAPLLEDLQYCGSQLGLSVEDSGGDVVATATAGGESVGTFTANASVTAPTGGTLFLGGPLRALRCHEATPRFEEDQLVVKRVAASGTTEVGRRPAVNGYLTQESDKLLLSVDSVSAGLEQGDPLVLEVWRESPSCGGTYGPTSVKLFTVTATVEQDEPDPTFDRNGLYTEVSHIVSGTYWPPAQAQGFTVSWSISPTQLIYRCTNTGNNQSCGYIPYGPPNTGTPVVFDGNSYSWTQPAQPGSSFYCNWPGNPSPDEWIYVDTTDVMSVSGVVTFSPDGSAQLVNTWRVDTTIQCPSPTSEFQLHVFTGTKPAPL